MRVLIASGGPGHTEIAIRQLAIMAESLPIKPTVLTVIKDPSEQGEADAILNHAAELLDPVFSQVEYKTRIGQPADEIVTESESGNYDLLVMGQRASRSVDDPIARAGDSESGQSGGTTYLDRQA
ncbi:MAG: universal stress protein [Chloroflexota bacterium]